MDFYEKYLKYKTKYLNLKQNLIKNADDIENQKGGGKPDISVLKNINLFKGEYFLSNPDFEEYLNPLHGFIMCNTGYIHNIYRFGGPDNNVKPEYNVTDDEQKLRNIIFNCIKKTFNIANGLFQPTNSLLNIENAIRTATTEDKKEKLKISPSDYGYFLGLKFLSKKYQCIKQYLLDIKRVLVKKEKDLIRAKNKEELSNCKSEMMGLTKIIDKFDCKNEFFHEKTREFNSSFNELSKNIMDDIKMYHYILSCMWWICDTKIQIKKYYEGLNKAFGEFNEILKYCKSDVRIPEIVVPVDFENELFKKEDYDSDENLSYEHALAKAYKTVNKILIYEAEYATNGEIRYADCGETVLRNFINILTYNKEINRFDTSILVKYGAAEKLIEYYSVFNNFELQSSEELFSIFGKELNARNAWSEVVIDLDKVVYLNHNKGHKYEINSKMNEDGKIENFLQVLINLFGNIETWEDFKKEDIVIELKLKRGLGTVEFQSKNGDYIMNFDEFHYNISSKLSDVQKITVSSPMEQFYIDVIMKNVKTDGIDIDNLYYINYTDDDLIELFNTTLYDIDRTLYIKMFNYMIKNFNDDQLNRIFPSILFLVINKKNNNDIDNKFPKYVSFYSDFEHNYENIKSIMINNFEYSLLHLIPPCLESITFGSHFNQNIDEVKFPDSLQSITFGFWFNQNIDEVKFPDSLQILTFGRHFNQKIDEVKFPANLQSITFGDYFNQKIDEVKFPANLQSITFGNYFNQKIDEVKFPNSLQSITFGYLFNQNIDKLLLLPNLQNITLPESFDSTDFPPHLKVTYI